MTHRTISERSYHISLLNCDTMQLDERLTLTCYIFIKVLVMSATRAQREDTQCKVRRATSTEFTGPVGPSQTELTTAAHLSVPHHVGETGVWSSSLSLGLCSLTRSL